MPNFKCKNIKNTPLPFTQDGVEFVYKATSDNSNLILVKIENFEFFITVKKNKNCYVVKGEKLTRPPKISLLQRALAAYKNHEAIDITNEATALKNLNQDKKESHIIQIQNFSNEFDILNKIYKNIFIEIGFGSGRHLLYQAEQNPNTLIIGIEVYKPSMEQVGKLAKLKGLNNIKLINTDARLLLGMIESNLIDRIFLHFPVPWPKDPHRRVVSKMFAGECQRVLKNGGKFELRTDEQDYAQYTLSQFLDLTNLQIIIKKNADLSITSKYEERWKKLQKNIFDLIYICDVTSEQNTKIDELLFNKIYDTDFIICNFKNTTKIFDGYFFHLEQIYKIEKNKAIIRVSLGDFNAPSHCYLLLDKKTIKYIINEPLKTKTNSLAHEALKEFFECKI